MSLFSRMAAIGHPASIVAGALLAAGCAVAPGEDVGVAEQAALNANALNANALNANALNANALNANALNANALDANALSPQAMSQIQDPGDDGALSRQLLRYTVSCALLPGQSFDFSWTDADGVLHQESYPGLLGLASYWATQPLDLAGEQWVSACLASRVNALGVSVSLSSRGVHPALATSPSERSTYQTREGVFFGNLFGSSPKLYACYDPASVIPAHFANRVCTEPQLVNLTVNDLSTGYDCGPIEVVGPCAELWPTGLALGPCAYVQHGNPDDRYFHDCSPPGSTDDVPAITTFLQGSIPW